MRGILCIDPGGSTGVAWGIVDERAPSAIEAVRDRLHSGSTTVTGEPRDQIHALYRLWTDFKLDCVNRRLLDKEWVDLVIEDYVLAPGVQKPGRDTTAPERIAWGFEGYRLGRFESYRKTKHYTEPVWQMPGAAKRFAERDILEQADCWIRGRDHERSAFAHMLLRTNVLMSNRLHTRRGVSSRA
ncbi:MAG TPA: hypothetical protein VJT32_04145 [bacterium]|nr:hypothetical protein [bacterium]